MAFLARPRKIAQALTQRFYSLRCDASIDVPVLGQTMIYVLSLSRLFLSISAVCSLRCDARTHRRKS